MKHLNSIQQEFQKLALKPQSLRSPKIHNLTSNNTSRIDATTYEIIIRTDRQFCHEQCPWLNRKISSTPYCKLFKSSLLFNNDVTKQAIIHKHCLSALNLTQKM